MEAGGSPCQSSWRSVGVDREVDGNRWKSMDDC